MTRYWVIALIVAVVGLLLIVRGVARRPKADDEREHAGLDPLAHAHRAGHAEAVAGDDVDRSGDLDDTAPAVLSPPEWTPPKSVSKGSRR